MRNITESPVRLTWIAVALAAVAMVLSLWANTTVNDARHLASLGMPSISLVDAEQREQTARVVAFVVGGGALAAAGGAVAANSAVSGSTAARRSPAHWARAGRS